MKIQKPIKRSQGKKLIRILYHWKGFSLKENSMPASCHSLRSSASTIPKVTLKRPPSARRPRNSSFPMIWACTISRRARNSRYCVHVTSCMSPGILPRNLTANTRARIRKIQKARVREGQRQGVRGRSGPATVSRPPSGLGWSSTRSGTSAGALSVAPGGTSAVSGLCLCSFSVISGPAPSLSARRSMPYEGWCASWSSP